MKPRLYIEQKITAFVNKYSVFEAQLSGEKGALKSFVQQKRVAFKEKVSFYASEDKSDLKFTLRAEKVMDVHGRYLVEDDKGQLVGMFKKQFGKSLLNSTWIVMDAQGTELFMLRESNMVLAVLRRFAGFVPYVGDLFEIVLLFFKYHFTITDISAGEVVGKYQKTTLLYDRYVMLMTDEAYARVDWRVMAAMGVGLDALQSR